MTQRSSRLHLDLTTLQLLIAVAESGSVTGAAERLNLATAAASRRIKDLEDQLGLPLFERRPHGMQLTDAGRSILAHARNITHTVMRMQDDAASHLGGAQGVVRLAAPKSVVAQFLPRDIQRCAQALPAVRIDLQEMNSQLVQQALLRGTVDLGFFESRLGGIDLPTHRYRQDELIVVAPYGHALGSRRRVNFDDLVAHPLIVLGEGSAISLTLERLADERGAMLRMRMRVGGFDSMAALVAEGLGLGIMPRAVAANVAVGARFSRITIGEAWALREFVLARRDTQSLSPAAEAVAQVLLQNDAG